MAETPAKHSPHGRDHDAVFPHLSHENGILAASFSLPTWLPVCCCEAPHVFGRSFQREISLEDSALHTDGPGIFRPGAVTEGSAVDDSNAAGPVLNGTFVRQEFRRMVEYPLGRNRMLKGRFGRLGQAKGDQGGLVFEHEIPVNALGRRVFLDDEALVLHPIAPSSVGLSRRGKLYNILGRNSEPW